MKRNLAIIAIFFAFASSGHAQSAGSTSVSDGWVTVNPSEFHGAINNPLYEEQAMVMNKAYCPSTVWCPSRTAILTGKRPSSTGVYSNQQDWTKAPKAKDVVTLPEYFSKHGYRSVSTGKIFHGSSGNAFQERDDLGGFNGAMLWKESPSAALGKAGTKNELLWGACMAPVEKTRGHVACQWAADQLKRDFDGKPFFISLGISKPHLPRIVPQQFFDLYPLEKFKPVEIFRDDLDDILREDEKPAFKPNAWFQDTDKANMHKQAQRAYLANIWYGGKADGAEELYDHSTDPLEHKNLAANPESKEIIVRLKKHLPTHDEPYSPRSGSNELEK